MGVTVTNLLSGEVDQRGEDRVALTEAVAKRTITNHESRLEAAATALAGVPGLVEAASGTGDLAAALESAIRPDDIDVVIVAGADGRVLGEARQPGAYAGGVEAPTASEILAEEDPGLVLTGRAPVEAGDLTLVVGRWLDNDTLEAIARDQRAELAIIAAGRVIAATEPLASTAATAIGGPDERRSVEIGTDTFLVRSTEIPDALLVTVVNPPPGTSSVQLLLILGALVVVMLVLVVLVGYVVSGLVTEPIQAVVDAAHAVARGELDQHVEVKGDREVAALGEAFNEMTDNLADHVRRLEESRTQFRVAIARLGDVLVSTHDIDGIIEVVIEACLLTTHAEVAAFYTRVAMPARIRVQSVVGGTLSAELNGTGVAGAAARKLAPAVHPGADALDPAEPRVDGAIAVPVRADGRLFGVVAVYGRVGGGAFGEEAVDTVQTLARQAEVAIGNAMLHDEARRQARTDGLTGLWNRREFELRCREAAREADRFGETFGVVVVDVDDFKLVNDRFDHTTGDAALIWLAARLDEATREIDMVARWGGEEFIVLLPRASLEDTEVVSERIRSSVDAAPMTYGTTNIPITVSVGFGAYPIHGSSPAEVFRAADAALLVAKRSGKNRIECAEAPEEAAS